MLFAPRASIATYVIWKCFEQYYFHAAKVGKVKHVEGTVVLIYAFSVSVLLYTFALEPRFIRPSYMKFIDRISDHKLHQVNRMGKLMTILISVFLYLISVFKKVRVGVHISHSLYF